MLPFASPNLPETKLPLWRGDDDPAIVWAFAATEAAGSFDPADFALIVQWTGRGRLPVEQGEFTRLSSDGGLVVDRLVRSVSWTPAVADFALVPRGAAIRYELKRLVAGRTRTLAWGEVCIRSGLMRDPTEDTGPAGQSYTDLRVAALRSDLLLRLDEQEAALRADLARAQPYDHAQPSPAMVWTIAHNRGVRPAVATFSVGGVEIEGSVQHLTADVLTVSFVIPVAGYARLA